MLWVLDMFFFTLFDLQPKYFWFWICETDFWLLELWHQISGLNLLLLFSHNSLYPVCYKKMSHIIGRELDKRHLLTWHIHVIQNFQWAMIYWITFLILYWVQLQFYSLCTKPIYLDSTVDSLKTSMCIHKHTS